MKRLAALALLTACLGMLGGGCDSTEKITRRSQLSQADRSKPLVLFTSDSVSYVLSRYSLTDSTLTGVGHRSQGSVREPFDGSLPLSAISYMQITKGNGFKTVLAIAAAGFVGYTALSYFLDQGGSGISVQGTVSHYNPRPWGGGGWGGGSCPFIQSWNGDRYVLDGEAYAVAWGKALEMTTSTLLSSVRADQGEVKVRITNERPETHYTNSVRLKAVQVDQGADAAPDARHALWPLAKPLPPLRARDNTGRDVTGSISDRDNLFWESSFSDISPTSEFEDVIDLTLPNPSRQDSGTMVIRAINSDIFDVVLKKVADVVGDESLEFVRALETDPELIALMRRWRDDASIKVDLWNGHAWEPAGSILPEANVAPFSRAIRISSCGAAGDSVRIRLRSLADVWKIDAVQVDWTPARALDPVYVPLRTASGPGGRDVAPLISRDDESYVITFPTDKVDLCYQAVDPLPGKHVIYALEVRGYLHEWMPGDHPEDSRTMMAGETGSGRVSLLKSLLRLRNVILPPIYAEWNGTKGRISGLK